MNSPFYENESLPLSNVGQAVDTFFSWLEREQRTISHYFDRHPSIRHSFLEAVQRVAGRELLVTPVATPAKSLDDEPATPHSPETADRPGSISHDSADQRAHSEATFAANNERLGNRLRRSLDGRTERVDAGGRSPLSVTAAVGDDPEATPLNPKAPSHGCPTRAHTLRRRPAKRKRPIYCEVDGRAHQGQLAGEMGTLSTLPADMLDKIRRIAGPEVLSILWDYLRAGRSPSNKDREALETPHPSDTSIEAQLSKHLLQYQRGIEGTSNEDEQYPEIPRRLFLASIIGLYIREREAQKPAKKRRKRNRDRNLDAICIPRRSLNDIFIDFLSQGDLLAQGKEGVNAKRSFDNMLQLGQRWARLVEYFGCGILLLLPRDLSNEDLRMLTLPELDALLEYLDSSMPSLRIHIQSLTSILPTLIEGRCVPHQMLRLEMFSESQIASGEYTGRSLRDLFEYSDD